MAFRSRSRARCRCRCSWRWRPGFRCWRRCKCAVRVHLNSTLRTLFSCRVSVKWKRLWRRAERQPLNRLIWQARSRVSCFALRPHASGRVQIALAQTNTLHVAGCQIDARAPVFDIESSAYVCSFNVFKATFFERPLMSSGNSANLNSAALVRF